VFFVTDFRARKEQDDAALLRQIPQPHGVLDMETRTVTKARVKPSQSSAVLPSPDHPSQNELLTTKELRPRTGVLWVRQSRHRGVPSNLRASREEHDAGDPSETGRR
jgi:hypothetical protein